VGYIRKVGNMSGVSMVGEVQVVSLSGKVGSADGSNAAGWGLSGGEGVLTTIRPLAYLVSALQSRDFRDAHLNSSL
jgi:hypothetical protein